MANSFIQAYRKWNPSDIRTDDELTVLAAKDPWVLESYPDLKADYDEIERIKIPAGPGAVEDVVRGFGRGALGAVAAIPQSLALTGAGIGNWMAGVEPQDAPSLKDNWMYRMGEGIQNLVPPPSQKAQESFWLGDVPQALGSGAGFIAGGLAGRAAKVPAMLATAGLGSATGGVQGYEDAIRSGADEDTAFKSFWLNAGVGTSEIVPLVGMVNRIDKFAGGGFRKALIEAAKNAGKETLEEAIQEAAQTTASNFIANGVLDYDKTRQLFQDVAPSAGAGGVAGFVMSAVTSAIGAALGGRRAQGGAPAAGTQITQPQPPGQPAVPPQNLAVDPNLIAPLPPPAAPPPSTVTPNERMAYKNLTDADKRLVLDLITAEQSGQPLTPEFSALQTILISPPPDTQPNMLDAGAYYRNQKGITNATQKRQVTESDQQKRQGTGEVGTAPEAGGSNIATAGGQVAQEVAIQDAQRRVVPFGVTPIDQAIAAAKSPPVVSGATSPTETALTETGSSNVTGAVGAAPPSDISNVNTAVSENQDVAKYATPENLSTEALVFLSNHDIDITKPRSESLIEDAVKSASENGEPVPDEVFSMVPYLAYLKFTTGKNKTFKQKVYQGKGSSLEQVYGSEAVKSGRATPLFGDAEYYTFDPEEAKMFGSVTEHTVELKNPLIIDNDNTWNDVLDASGAKALHSMSSDYFKNPQKIVDATKKIRRYAESKGHDGVIISVSIWDDSGKRLGETAGISQVIKFNNPQLASTTKTISKKPTIATKEPDAIVKAATTRAKVKKAKPVVDEADVRRELAGIPKYVRVEPETLVSMVDLDFARSPLYPREPQKGVQSAMPFEATNDKKRLFADSNASHVKGAKGQWTAKIGVFKSKDGQHFMLSTVYSNSTGKFVTVMRGDKARGMDVLEVLSDKGLGYSIFGAIKTKQDIPIGSVAYYTPEEWASIQAQIENVMNLEERRKTAEESEKKIVKQVTTEKGVTEEIANQEDIDAAVDEPAEIEPIVLTEADAQALIDAVGRVDYGVVQDIDEIMQNIGRAMTSLKNVDVLNRVIRFQPNTPRRNTARAKQVFKQICESYVSAAKLSKDRETIFTLSRRNLQDQSGATEPTDQGNTQGMAPGDATGLGPEGRATYQGSVGLLTPVSEIEDKWNLALTGAQNSGMLVQLRNEIAGQTGQPVGLYTPATRTATVVVSDAQNNTPENLRRAVHEIAHDVIMTAPVEIQQAALRGVNRWTNEDLGVSGSPDPRIRNRTITNPVEMAHELLAEKLALEGIQQPIARGLADRIMTILRDWYYRAAMSLQRMFGRPASEALAQAYFQNRMGAVLAGRSHTNLFDFLIMPMTKGQQLRMVLTPATPTGWLAERLSDDGQIEYGAVIDAPPTFYTMAGANEDQFLANTTVAKLNEQIVLNDRVSLQASQNADVIAAAGTANPLKWVMDKLGLHTPARRKDQWVTKATDKDARLSQFQDVDTRRRLGTELLAALMHKQRDIIKRRDAAKDHIEKQKDLVKIRADRLAKTEFVIADVSGISTEVREGAKELVRGLDWLGGIQRGNQSRAVRNLQELAGDNYGANVAQYQADFRKLLTQEDFFSKLFDKIDSMLKDGVDFKQTVTQIRDYLADQGKREYDEFTGTDTTNQVKLAAMVAYAQSNSWVLVRADLRRADPTEREKIVKAVKDYLYQRQDPASMLQAIKMASMAEQRALIALQRELRELRSQQQELDDAKGIAAAADLALQYYNQDIANLSNDTGHHSDQVMQHGFKYLAPVKDNLEQRTIRLAPDRQILDRATVRRDMATMKDWLLKQEAAKANGKNLHPQYMEVKAQLDEIQKYIVEPDLVTTRYRMAGLHIGSAADWMTSFGLPVGRLVSKMLKMFSSNHLLWRAKADQYGLPVERAANEAMAMIDLAGGDLSSYLENYFEPAVDYIESRRDLLERYPGNTAKQLDEAFEYLTLWLKKLPDADPRKAMVAGKEAAFMKAVRRHVEANDRANVWLESVNVPYVVDPRTGGMVRERYKQGPVTFMIGLSRPFRAIWDAMHPQGGPAWTAVISPGNNIPGLFDGDTFAKLYAKDGPDAVRAQLQPLFADQALWDYFVGGLATLRKASPFPGIMVSNENGTSATEEPLSPPLVQQAYYDAQGDIVKFVEGVYQLHGMKFETQGKYMQRTLKMFQSYYKEFTNIMRHDSTKTPSLENLVPGVMIHARMIELWPSIWRQHIHLDRNSMRRVVDRVAAQQAFGIESQRLIANVDELEREVNSEVGKLNKARELAKTMQAGKRWVRKREFEQFIINQPDIKTREEYERLLQIEKSQKFIARFRVEFPLAFKIMNDPDEIRFARTLLGFGSHRMLEQIASALAIASEFTSIFRNWGISPTTAKAAVKWAKSFGVEPVGSIAQAVSDTAIIPQSQFRKEFAEALGGSIDPGAYQDLATRVKQRGEVGESGFTKASRGLLKTDAILSAAIGKQGTQAKFVTLRPAAPFTSASLTGNLASMEATASMMDMFVRPAMEYLKTHPDAQQDPGWGVKADEWIQAIGIKGKDVGPFRKLFGSLEFYSAKDFRSIVEEAMQRDARGEGIFSPETVLMLAGMSLQQLSLEQSPANTSLSAYNSSWYNMFMKLMGWAVRNSFEVSRMGLDAQGKGRRWLELPKNRADWATAQRMILALIAMSAGGLATGVLIDWYNEFILGKRRNLRQLDWQNPTSENVLAAVEQLARIGTLGLFMEGLNAGINVGTGQGDNRGISLDQRVVAASSLINFTRAIGTMIHQGQADYAGVVRPMFMSMGGNGALQYMQLVNRAFGLDNAESRAVARTNASNWLRASGRTLGMEVRTSIGGYNTPTSVTPYLTKMLFAAYANNLMDFQTAYQAAVAKARTEGKEDPVDYVKRAFEGRHPLLSVFRSRPSAMEYQQLLESMPERGRQDVSEAVRSFNAYAQSIGAKPFTGTQVQQPRAGGARTWTTEQIRSRIIGRMGESPVQRNWLLRQQPSIMLP